MKGMQRKEIDKQVQIDRYSVNKTDSSVQLGGKDEGDVKYEMYL